MKPKAEQRNSKQLAGPESIEHSAHPATHCSLHKYNLRSKGPPRYVRFSDVECPICLEDFSSPVVVNCGHSFCKACIEKCMKKGIPALCPICKDRLIKRLFMYNLQYLKHENASDAEHRNNMTMVQEQQNTKLSHKLKKAARRTVA